MEQERRRSEVARILAALDLLSEGGRFCGLLGALNAGLLFGGSACLRHFALRWLLPATASRRGATARFLNDMTSRRFLLRSGSGYLFIHRMLLDHFADEQSPTERPPWPVPSSD